MQLRDIPKDIPETPGVYTFLDGQEILYIGKATNLKDRIKSYMSSDLEAMRGPKIVRMRERANKVMWQETRSVLEALIAESHAIKNISLHIIHAKKIIKVMPMSSLLTSSIHAYLL
ncbi:MAG: nucleotide excision repair endonuclease [Candidatus Pacebacteria bacterium]|nr:nucleotide excision repair endonuclease [Candidatus Paceibacterota bacterium]